MLNISISCLSHCIWPFLNTDSESHSVSKLGFYFLRKVMFQIFFYLFGWGICLIYCFICEKKYYKYIFKIRHYPVFHNLFTLAISYANDIDVSWKFILFRSICKLLIIVFFGYYSFWGDAYSQKKVNRETSVQLVCLSVKPLHIHVST